MTHYSDIYGRYLDATGIMRQYWRDSGEDESLAAWLERQSHELWAASGEHRDEDWDELSVQVRADALHGDWTLDDVAAGWAQVVVCPECGQTEIWSNAELSDHGKCRGHRGLCPVCGH